MNIKERLDEFKRDDYQRDNFDAFLKKINFKYNIPSIHIAGSNGKGSTAIYLASIYQEAGYKVGLFTSPSFLRINEQIKINDVEIGDEEIEKFIDAENKLIRKYQLSSFEVLTYVAFSYFMHQKCDVAIIECGMGGEYDATNIFESVCSIITSVSLEHSSYLGRSLSEIAEHKAGIISYESPIVIPHNLNEDVIDVIASRAKEKKAPLITAVEPSKVGLDNGYNFTYISLQDLHIQSSLFVSIRNACLAIEAVKALNDKLPIKEEDIKVGLANVKLIGRMDLVNNSRLIIDGGHNPEAIQNLCESLINITNGQPIHVVLASFKDKNIERMLAFLGEVSNDISLTYFDHPRCRSEEDYFLFLEDHKFYEDTASLINEKLSTYPDDYVLITGSYAFAGYVYGLIKDGKINF